VDGIATKLSSKMSHASTVFDVNGMANHKHGHPPKELKHIQHSKKHTKSSPDINELKKINIRKPEH
jgi:hypothetical protein